MIRGRPAVRESRIENYLVQQVYLHGGLIRKWTGHRGAPDRIVIWPAHKGMGLYDSTPARIHFIETKSPTGKVRSHQKREHARLRDAGCRVFVLHTKEAVDFYMKWRRHD